MRFWFWLWGGPTTTPPAVTTENLPQGIVLGYNPMGQDGPTVGGGM